MRATALFAAITLFLPAVAHGNALDRPDIPAEYQVGKEDVLELAVLKYPDLGGPVTVRPDGKITLKLVGDVAAEGRTVGQISEEVAAKLETFIPGALVTLSVKVINSMKVYVIGRVGAPGMFNVGANITTLQALALAKGFTPWARKNKLVLVRGTTGKRIKLDYSKVVSGKQENLTLFPGDTLVVP